MKAIKRGMALVMAAALLAATGCGLMPVEEQLPDAPVVRRGAATEFTLTYVQRGDLVATQRYSATYRAVRQEQLSFAVSGVHFDKTYVQEGDTVRAGQLVAELEQETLDGAAREQQARIDRLTLDIAQQEEKRELARERYAIEWSYMDEEEREEAVTLEETLRPYERAIRALEDERTVAEAQRDAMDATVRERQLRAGIGGTVTYLRTMDPADLSDVNETVMVISDSGSSMFVVSADDPEQFTEGMPVDVTMGMTNAVYPCTVVSAKAAGALEPEEDKVYLKTDAVTAELSDGDRGHLVLELGRREDVLYLNERAVKRMDDKQFVYVQDENGLRSAVEVATGFEADGNVEILSGLQEGDAVILK